MHTHSPEFNWLVENSIEVFNQYRGKWIAVYEGKVVGVGDTATEADRQAREAVGDVRFVLEALDKETDVIYGHL